MAEYFVTINVVWVIFLRTKIQSITFRIKLTFINDWHVLKHIDLFNISSRNREE